ncbi:MAG: hypothetical protein ACXW12_18190 [Burkholderiales bacterium]
MFAADPNIIILGYPAIALLHLGLVNQGRAPIREAYARAGALGEPGQRMAALWFDALFEVRLGNAEHVAEVAEPLRTLAEEYALPQGHAAHFWFRGWAEAQLGRARAGYRLIREGYDEALGLGIRAWGSETLGYAVEALTRAGELRARFSDRLAQRVLCSFRFPERVRAHRARATAAGTPVRQSRRRHGSR